MDSVRQLLVVVVLVVATATAAAAMATAARADEPAPPAPSGSVATTTPPQAAGLPTWRLAVEPFGSGGYGLGVYRRLSPRWDGGIQVFTDLRDSESDRVTTDPVYADADTVLNRSSDRGNTIALSFDARRWFSPLERVSVFLGPRLNYTYQSGHRREVWYRSGTEGGLDERTGDSSRQSTGAALLLGGDLRLLANLSMQVTLQPLRFYYLWEDRETREVVVDQVVTRDSASAASEQGTSFTTSLSTGFSITLYW